MASNLTHATLLPQTALPIEWSLADLQRHLGGIPLDRIRLYPPPGMATEQDAMQVRNRDDRLCELIDGVLVEKAMGSYESFLAGVLIQLINNYLGLRIGWASSWVPTADCGCCPQGCGFRTSRSSVGSVSQIAGCRATACSAWHPTWLSRFSRRETQKEKCGRSWRNTFPPAPSLSGISTLKAPRARAYAAPDRVEEIGVDGLLSGAAVLPGFEIRLGDLLDRVPREP